MGCRVLIHAKPVMQQSWDYRAKQCFYVGPALDHYRCYKLVKSETKQKVISDMVEFRHAYLQIPVVSADVKIINWLQGMTGALQNAPPPTSSNQLDAIEMLRTLFEKWKLLAPPALLNDSCAVRFPRESPLPAPSRVQDTTPAPNCTNNPCHALEIDDDDDTSSATTWFPPPLPVSMPWTPAQRAWVAPFQQVTPMCLVFDDVGSPSGPSTTSQPSPPPLPRVSVTPSPIARCTRSRIAPPQHSSLAALVQYHFLPPTQHSLKSPCPPNLPVYCKHWRFQSLSWLNLPVSVWGCPLLMRDTALRYWIRNPANYSSIANSNKTHTTKKFGTAHTLMNLGISAKA